MGRERIDFEAFYRACKDECLLAVLVNVGDRDTAQELVAEAFARAWASWSKISRHPAPQAWVVRTAVNAGVSRWRRHRREVMVADPALLTTRAVSDPTAAGIDPELFALLTRLPVRQREVVTFRLLLDLDTARTAALLGIAPGTVQAHLARALATLRDELSPQPKESFR